MKKLAFILSFVGGATDTLGFSLLYQIFTAHVTGNFVLIGSSLANTHDDNQLIWAQLSVLPIFFLTVTFASTLIPAKTSVKTARQFLGVQGFLLLLFFVFGTYFNNDINNLKAIMIAAPAIMAMSLQNMYSKFLFVKLPFTTVMTGNVTKIAMDLGSRFKKNQDDEPKSLLSLQVFAAIGFISGALIIALAAGRFGFASAVLPAALILFLAVNVNQKIIE